MRKVTDRISQLSFLLLGILLCAVVLSACGQNADAIGSARSGEQTAAAEQTPENVKVDLDQQARAENRKLHTEYGEFCVTLEEKYPPEKLEQFAKEYLLEALEIEDGYLREMDYEALLACLRERVKQGTDPSLQERPEAVLQAEKSSATRLTWYIAGGLMTGGLALGGLAAAVCLWRRRTKGEKKQAKDQKALPEEKAAGKMGQMSPAFRRTAMPALERLERWETAEKQSKNSGRQQELLERIETRDFITPSQLNIGEGLQEPDRIESEDEKMINYIFSDPSQKSALDLFGYEFMDTNFEEKSYKEVGLSRYYTVTPAGRKERAEFARWGSRLYPNPLVWAGRDRFRAASGYLLSIIFEAVEKESGRPRDLLEMEGYTIMQVEPAIVDGNNRVVKYGRLLMKKKDSVQ